MSENLALIMGCTGIAVFFCVISIFAITHYFNANNENDKWLFGNWQDKVYHALFNRRKPEYIAKKIGIDISKYLHNCKMLRISNNLKAIIVYKIIGFIVLLVSILFSFIVRHWMPIVIGIVPAFILITIPIQLVTDKMNKRRNKMTEELPRYLDMLHTALLVNMPVEQAIKVTSEHLKGTILAEEFNRALADTQLGASSWPVALEKLATDYEIDGLSDFVLDVVTAYNHGNSITEAVERQSKDIKRSNLLSLKEKASKLTNTILFPVLVFKILPLLAIMCIPIIYQLNATGFGM